MSDLSIKFNKSAKVNEVRLAQDVENLLPRSKERIVEFAENRDRLEREYEDKLQTDRTTRIKEQFSEKSLEPRLTMASAPTKERVSSAQIDAFFQKAEALGIDSAKDFQPENRVEKAIQHAWHQVQVWEQQQLEQRAVRRFEDTRAFIDKLMTLDEFNRAVDAPRRDLDDGRSL
jgi:hypothetical protein